MDAGHSTSAARLGAEKPRPWEERLAGERADFFIFLSPLVSIFHYGKVHRTQNLPFESAPSGSHHITVQPSPLSSSRIFPACPKETLCPFAVPPCHPPPPAPGHHSLIFASAFIDSEHVIQRDSYGDPCVSGFVHSAYCFQSSSMLEHVLVLRSFLWLNNIPL